MSSAQVDDAHRDRDGDHGLALALRACGDPVPVVDLAARARAFAERADVVMEERLARGRRVVRGIEMGVGVVIFALGVVLLSNLDVVAVLGGNSAVSTGIDSDPWMEVAWIAAAACVAAVVYAVIARAEPLRAPGSRRRISA